MNSNREISARRITQGDIAHHAGVSASTVSRALQNDPRITKAVRKKILLVSQKLGYQPDPSISALINYRWKSQPSNFVGVVAWITINDEPGELKKNSPEIDLYWEGAQKGAHRFGYRIDEFSIRDATSLTQLEKVLHARNVKGLLIPPELQHFSEWGALHATNLSIVRLSRSVQNLNVHMVTPNQTADGILAARKMHELGYRRIGYVGSKIRERLFYPGFSWELNNQPEAELIPPLFLNEIPEEKHARVLAEWIHRYKLDAILEDFSGIYELLHQSNLRIPYDLGIATQNALRNPGTAGIKQNLEEVGRVGILMLISLINDHDFGIPTISRQVQVQGQWIDGATLPPCHLA